MKKVKINMSKDYYRILGVEKYATPYEIKKAYRNMAMKLHPDRNNGDSKSESNFMEVTEAYSILSDDKLKKEYDKKSKWGLNYNELIELLDYDFDDYTKFNSEDKLKEFKNREQLTVIIRIDDTFDGSVKYERYVTCKTCKGSGKDTKSKIQIKDAKGNILKMFDSDDGCDFCFEGDNYVITKNGPVKINKIIVGDLVLSKDNSYQRVTHLMNREYSGKVLDINVSGITINGVTPNHKLNVVKFEKNKQGRIKINRYNIVELPASEVTKDDFILYQKQCYAPGKSVYIGSTHNREAIEIDIDDDFIKFISCYISEGNTRGNRVVVFTFHKYKDEHLLNFIKKYTSSINVKAKFFTNDAWGKYVMKVEIFDSQLARFLIKFCGHTSVNKYINPSIMGMSDHSLLDTLVSCDGYKKGNNFTYTTVSKRLAYQVLHLSISLGYSTSISRHDSYIDRNLVNHKVCYRVYISKSKKMGMYHKRINEGLCIKVKGIQSRDVECVNVYNITVENTHKYTIDGLLVNNCEGTGKSYNGLDCGFCYGEGKVGMKECPDCKGEKRILGKQKLSKIDFPKDAKDHKVEFMGHVSKDNPGMVGHLWLVRKKESE